jgi:hypothetical protein
MIALQAGILATTLAVSALLDAFGSWMIVGRISTAGLWLLVATIVAGLILIFRAFAAMEAYRNAAIS